MKKVPLTQGLFALVSDHRFEFITQWSWYAGKYYKGLYRAMRKENGSTIYMHRVLADAPDGVDVDHRDGNPLNNQDDNLRVCSHRQNTYNKHMQPNDQYTSNYKGVSRHRKSWRARIVVDGKTISLGYFPTELDAAVAYDYAARRHFGPFASLNFPGEGERLWNINTNKHSNIYFPRPTGSQAEEAIS